MIEGSDIMIKYRSVHNDEMLGYIHYKLQKRIDRIDSVNETFDKIENFGGSLSENFTFGTEKNVKTLEGTSIIPAVPLAIGVGALAVHQLLFQIQQCQKQNLKYIIR